MPNANVKFRLDIPKFESTFLSVLKKEYDKERSNYKQDT